MSGLAHHRCLSHRAQGFRDLLHIGNQARPKLFDLNIQMPEVLYAKVRPVVPQCQLAALSDPLDIGG
jgi:N-methylhydantoinase A/oxoprolinase/acetone carboxylase beta subunit